MHAVQCMKGSAVVSTHNPPAAHDGKSGDNRDLGKHGKPEATGVICDGLVGSMVARFSTARSMYSSY